MSIPVESYSDADPATTAGVIGQIRIRRQSLFPAEGRVADVVLADPWRVVHLTISELAALASVSEGTIVRFCQSVGFGGYQSLKIGLAVGLARPTEMIHGEIEQSDSVGTIASRVFASDLQALMDTRSVLDEAKLQHVVDALAGANRIEFFAVGTSLPVAYDAYSHLLRIGLPVHLDLDTYLQLMQASLLSAGDVAFAISHSGRSPEPVQCLKLARERGATTLAITGSDPSPLAEAADATLLTVSGETKYREEAMASRIAQLSLINTIYVATALRRPASAVEGLRLTSEAISDLRRRLAPSGGRRRTP